MTLCCPRYYCPVVFGVNRTFKQPPRRHAKVTKQKFQVAFVSARGSASSNVTKRSLRQFAVGVWKLKDEGVWVDINAHSVYEFVRWC